MLTPLIVVTILLLFYLKSWKEIKKDRKDKHWVVFLSFMAIGMSILVALDIPVHILMKLMNQTIGEITKQVIKI